MFASCWTCTQSSQTPNAPNVHKTPGPELKTTRLCEGQARTLLKQNLRRSLWRLEKLVFGFLRVRISSFWSFFASNFGSGFTAHNFSPATGNISTSDINLHPNFDRLQRPHNKLAKCMMHTYVAAIMLDTYLLYAVAVCEKLMSVVKVRAPSVRADWREKLTRRDVSRGCL